MANNNPQSRHTFARHVAPFAPVALALLMTSAHRGGSKPVTPPPVEDSSGGGGEGFSQTCTNPHFPPNSGPTTIDATSCTNGGNGGAEEFQNEAKNNFCAVGPAKVITLPELVNLQAEVQKNSSIPFGNPRSGHPLSVTAGPATDRKPLQALGEGTEVILQGFVLKARQEGAESVNCKGSTADIPTNHDIHISIVDSASQQDECSGVVAEMIPHHRPASWTADNVNAVALKRLPVRVTGQLFFDSSHSPCRNGSSSSGDPKRVSLWEVHPIYEFDVCPQGDCSNGNGWVTLEAFLKE
jgi:hypothetical protein